ncbi:hypothetical protein [Streptomyces apocyni]|uniref:hypothetical protein n=1 Tax=Streptomyces apocyni TaxID=2654677 RepID=UPI0012E9EAC1|nr:hypothetical protein [Streptomyces apocyni]
MANVTRCPSCGERDELRGEPQGGDIRVSCLSCGAQWMRGATRCAGCGGDDIVERPQAMTRHSRGTQLSIIGWRQTPLCRVCDADAVTTSIDENVPVPGDYVSVCLYGDGEGPVRTSPAAATPVPTPAPAPTPAPVQEAKPAPPRPRRTRPQPTPKATQKATPTPTTVPTVRQAIAAFLGEASGQADSTAMLLLGTHLGSHNRLGVLDEPGAADRLAEWCDGHWPDRGTDAAQRALGTICRAVAFWGAQGWLTTDPAARLNG